MTLKVVAEETLQITNAGKYQTVKGKWVDFSQAQANAENGTKLYTSEDFERLAVKDYTVDAKKLPSTSLKIEVTDETTQVCAYRLVVEESYDHVVLLNFASAKNPGGGFLKGAKAQEEDLARCSGLYACQQKQFAYYDKNRKYKNLLYLDEVIYSPEVPWFRRNSRELLDDVFLASVITAPAPNAGQYLKRNPNGQKEVEATLRQRTANVLATAVDNGHRTLILGAWGCGVFRNDPELVADAFATWLASDRFLGCFDKVVFAVYDTSKDKKTFKAFQDRLL